MSAPAARNALIAERISPPTSPYYVYLLIDPRSKKPFYVGKGTGERFRSHGEAALLEDAADSPDERRAKLERIREIRAAGREPEVVFARIQITSKDEAYQLEAALIDALDRYATPLVNEVRGHDTASGLTTLEDLERELAAPEFTTTTPAILIKLFDWKAEVDPDTGRPGGGFRSNMTADEQLESARAWGILDPRRAANYRFAVTIHNGITRGVWEIDPASWRSWTPRPGRKLRWSFVGSEAPPEIVEAFIGRVGRRAPRVRPDGRAVFEARLIGLARAAKRVKLDNGTTPPVPALGESDQAEVEAFLEDMLVIYPLVGVDAFVPPVVLTAQPSLRLNGRGVEAFGDDGPAGFVVRAGSFAAATEVPSILAYLTAQRADLVAADILVADGARLRFVEDRAFNSPSAAAGVVLGRSANGRIEWKNAAGTSLKDLQAATATAGPP